MAYPKKQICESQPEQYSNALTESYWRAYPEKYCEEYLQMKLSNQQLEASQILGKLCRTRTKRAMKLPLTLDEESMCKVLGISIHSGHNTGKTTWLGAMILWWIKLWSYPEGRVTAPTQDQITNNVWKEIRQIIRKSHPLAREWFEKHLDINSEKISRKEDKETKGEWFIAAKTCNAKASEEEQGETLAGAHKENLAYFVEESSGVKNGVFKPIEGALAGAVNFALLIGNPVRSSGYFAETHKRDRRFWIPLRWDCEDSNLDDIEGSGSDIKGFIERNKSKYGRDSNFYRVRVRGLMPLSEPDVLISLDWLEDARGRELIIDEKTPIFLSIDVGAGGNNKTSVTARKGPRLLSIKRYDFKNSDDLCDRISLDHVHLEPACVKYDAVGVGWALSSGLKARGFKNVTPYKGSETAIKYPKFRNVRDEDYWKLRELFEEGIISLPDYPYGSEDRLVLDELIGQLSTIKWFPGTKNEIKVETKKEMKARGIESPDDADSVVMLFSIKDEAYSMLKTDDYEDVPKRKYSTNRCDERSYMAA